MYAARKFVYVLTATMLACFMQISFISPAHAEHSPETIISNYDDQSEDTLELTVSTTHAECDHSGGGGPTPWFSDLTVTNTATSTSADISFIPNTGGTLAPGESASHRYSSTGSDNISPELAFQFVGTPEDEVANIIIEAPNPGCDGKGGTDLTCYLNNYTPQDPSYINENGSYYTGKLISLTVHLSGQHASSIENIDFEVSSDGGNVWDIRQSGSDTNFALEFTDPGTYQVQATLRDAEGTLITPSGGSDCDVELNVVQADSNQEPSIDDDPVPNIIDDSGLLSGPGDATVITVPGGSASAEQLPVTGARTTFMVTMGLALLVIGVGFVWLGKRRKPLIDPDWEKFLTLG